MKNVSRMLFLFIVLNLGLTTIARADEDDLQHYVVRLRTLYVMPTEEFDSRLSLQ